MATPTEHTVVATVTDLDAAREVLRALSRAGIDADEISLLGKAAEKVTSDPDTQLRDLDATEDVAKSAARKGVIGSSIGGVAGEALEANRL